MPSDLNKIISSVVRDAADLDQRLKLSLSSYDHLYQEANRQLMQERMVTGSAKGLEDFYHFVQTVRRNRDVMGSLVRGLSSLRSLKSFKIIEEDIPEQQPKKPPKKRRGGNGALTPVPAPMGPTEPSLRAEELIPSEDVNA